LTARRTIGSQSGLTKHRVDRVDLSNTYRVIVLGLGLGLSLWGSTVGHPWQQLGLLFVSSMRLSRDKIVQYSCAIKSPMWHRCNRLKLAANY